MTMQPWHDGNADAMRRALVRRIDALDGYPVAALIDAWPHDSVSVDAVLRHVLRQWIDRLDNDLRLLPADASPPVGSSRVDLQACKLEYSIVSPK